MLKFIALGVIITLIGGYFLLAFLAQPKEILTNISRERKSLDNFCKELAIEKKANTMEIKDNVCILCFKKSGFTYCEEYKIF